MLIQKRDNSQKNQLFIIATPIGNAEDISNLALKTIGECDFIICEDSRVSYKLLNKYNIKKPIEILNNFNEKKAINNILEKITKVKSVVLISDAGCPLINDPGYLLIRECIEKHIYIECISINCAYLNAAILSGFPTNKINFHGFISKKAEEQYNEIMLLETKTNHSFYITPHIILKFLKNMIDKDLKNLNIMVARELTKNFQTLYWGSILELYEYFEKNPQEIKGEFVIVFYLKEPIVSFDILEVNKLYNALKKLYNDKEIIKIISNILNIKKSIVYQLIKGKKE